VPVVRAVVTDRPPGPRGGVFAALGVLRDPYGALARYAKAHGAPFTVSLPPQGTIVVTAASRRHPLRLRGGSRNLRLRRDEGDGPDPRAGVSADPRGRGPPPHPQSCSTRRSTATVCARTAAS
jgi:hypothetical protein